MTRSESADVGIDDRYGAAVIDQPWNASAGAPGRDLVDRGGLLRTSANFDGMEGVRGSNPAGGTTPDAM